MAGQKLTACHFDYQRMTPRGHYQKTVREISLVHNVPKSSPVFTWLN